MTDQTPRKNWLVPVLALLLLVSGWLMFRAIYPPFTPPGLPAANGYDDFLKAAEKLAKRTGFYREMSPEELESVVEYNRPALKLAREGLTKACRVPLDWSADQAWLDKVHMEELNAMRSLGRAFGAEARQASREGNIELAVQCGLDTIDLANKCSQGGLLVDRMVAGGVHYGALFNLQEQVSKLNKADALRLLRNLHSTPLNLEPIEDLLPRERAMFRQINGGLQTLLMTGVIRTQYEQMLQQMKQSSQTHDVLEKLLQTHIALHAYQLDHEQHFPDELDSLVPEYLDHVPLDNFSGNPLIYHPTAQGYRLYSVGMDGVDDEGVESTDGRTGDLLLEVSQ